MKDLHGLSLLVDKLVAEHDKTKESLQFVTRWIELKYRDGGRITAREYKEFLNELVKIDGEVK